MSVGMKTMKSMSQPSAAAERGRLAQSVERVNRALGLLETWRLRYQRRMQFADIDRRILRDTGIGEAQRFLIVNKPFWRA